MKTLNRPEFAASLIVLVLCLLLSFFGDHIFSFIFSFINKEYLQFLSTHKYSFFIAIAALIIFFSIQIHHKKVLCLEERYYGLFNNNPVPMFIVDIVSFRYMAANSAAVEMYGYTQKEFLALSVADIRVKEEFELIYEDIKTIDQQIKKAGIRRHRKKNGEVIIVELSCGEVMFNNKRCMFVLAQNIKEIENAKEEKRIAKEKIKQQIFTSYVIENFPVDVAVFDKDHRYILLNKTAVKSDEMRKWMIGKDDFDYFRLKGTDLSMAEKRRERFLKAIAGESREWIDEHMVGGELKYMLRKFYPYYEDGELKCVYGYGMDITEIKKAQAQRDEHIEQLEKIAFTTSHKIRQPICNLQGLVSLLKMEKIESQDIENIMSCMQNSLNTLDDFTRDLAIKLHEYKQNLSKHRSES